MPYHRINVDPDTYDDITVLTALIVSKSANRTVRYLLDCYAVYCANTGVKNYEYLQESRRNRGKI